ncbi:metallophosphoesterase family protein [Spirosoma sp. BT702]|uniref:Metallophosphoesterase family protein n=1 Tax=Spirosoma profusum TaxID=2771354 RepID=A0A927ARI6_9BACT|nr:metallophosphoesterase family protein [Spirosoma profusum]MBD2702388.1 metallophosphoesterase family protein [Spirosoma profusum]
MKTILPICLIWLLWQPATAQLVSTTLVAHGAMWRYSDKSSTPPDQVVGPTTYTWKDLGYDDSSPTSWSSGASELGYGDDDEASKINYGPENDKYRTAYFRKTVSDVSYLNRFRYKVRYKRDDGIVIYLNGVEIRRDGMPSGVITYLTSATLNAEESIFHEFYIPNGALRSGNNVIAAEVHQIGPTSSDLSFSLEFIAESNNNTLAASGLPVTSLSSTNWKYSDNGADLGTSWRNLAYDDSFWQQTNIGSRVRMGYGETNDPNQATVDPASSDPYDANTYTNYISYGLNPANKFPTTYFRKKINIPNVNANPGYEIRFMRDDGILIYVNGSELPRDANGNTNNMPGTPVSYTTLATASVDAPAETTWSAWQPISTSLLQNGDNIIAAEIHQVGPTTSDITFNIEIRVPGVPEITRGPYLTLGTKTGATIRWRTNVANIGQVTYGLSTTSLTGVVSEPSSTTEHVIQLTGLQPDKQYFYTVGTTSAIIQQGTDNYFLTAPLGNTKRKIRIAAFGDCGSNETNDNQIKARDGFLAFRGNNPIDLWMLIGDNSYDGDDPTYQTKFFSRYQTTSLMKNSMIYAIPGNHDYNNSPTLAENHNIPYFDIFNFPTNAEAGGVASGTKEWYSFDYGPIHFVMLDGYGRRNVGGIQRRFYEDTLNHPQVIWLKEDLAKTNKKWKIVYQHYPSYSQGSHNSENSSTDADMVAIRQVINPIMERFGVDMVITGHSHVYERSYPLHDLYSANSMTPYSNNPSAFRFAGDESNGRYDGSGGSCPYKKTAEKKKQGTVYVVSGSAGALEKIAGLGNHPAMVYTQKDIGGSFYFEVEDNRLDAKFLQNLNTNPPYSYNIADQFTILKDVGIPQSLTVASGQSVTLTSPFISNYVWTNPADPGFSASSRSVVISPPVGTHTYQVRDVQNCVQNTFTVQVSNTPSPNMQTVKIGDWNDPTIWSGNRVPGPSDQLRVKHLITIPDNTTVFALKVTYDPGIQILHGQNAYLKLQP